MNTMKYSTSLRIEVPKLWGASLFCNKVVETDKAIRFTDIVQDTEDGNGLMIVDKWFPKSLIKEIVEEKHSWAFEYLHLFNGQPAGQSNHRRIA